MNYKQTLFINEYLTTGNATESAIRAGYSPKTAYSTGQRMLKNVEIKQALHDAQARLSKEAEVTVKDIVLEIKMLMKSTKSEVIKLRCMDMLMKHLGGYLNENLLLTKLPEDILNFIVEKFINSKAA